MFSLLASSQAEDWLENLQNVEENSIVEQETAMLEDQCREWRERLGVL
jgi:hypothetical protein